LSTLQQVVRDAVALAFAAVSAAEEAMLYDTVHPSVIFSSILSIWKNFRDAADSAHATALELAQMAETALNAANAAQSSLRSSEERVEAAEADSQNLRFELEAARAALEH